MHDVRIYCPIICLWCCVTLREYENPIVHNLLMFCIVNNVNCSIFAIVLSFEIVGNKIFDVVSPCTDVWHAWSNC